MSDVLVKSPPKKRIKSMPDLQGEMSKYLQDNDDQHDDLLVLDQYGFTSSSMNMYVYVEEHETTAEHDAQLTDEGDDDVLRSRKEASRAARDDRRKLLKSHRDSKFGRYQEQNRDKTSLYNRTYYDTNRERLLSGRGERLEENRTERLRRMSDRRKNDNVRVEYLPRSELTEMTLRQKARTKVILGTSKSKQMHRKHLATVLQPVMSELNYRSAKERKEVAAMESAVDNIVESVTEGKSNKPSFVVRRGDQWDHSSGQWYQKTVSGFIDNMKAYNVKNLIAKCNDGECKIVVEKNFANLLVLKKTGQRQLNNQMYSMYSLWQKAEHARVSVSAGEGQPGGDGENIVDDELMDTTGTSDNDTGGVKVNEEAALRGVYSKHKYHTKTYEKVGFDTASKEYTDLIELNPESAGNRLDGRKKTVLARKCDNDCEELPDDWALIVHEFLKLTKTSDCSFLELHANVMELERCERCFEDGSSSCPLEWECPNLSRLLRRLSWHYSGIRTLLRIWNHVRELNRYLCEVDMCLRTHNYEMLMSWSDKENGLVPELIGNEVNPQEFNDETLQLRQAMHNQTSSENKYAVELRTVQNNACLFFSEECALCLRDRHKSQMKATPFNNWPQLLTRPGDPVQTAVVALLKRRNTMLGFKLCKECALSTRTCVVPQYSELNQMGYDETPEVLAVLNTYESMFLPKVKALQTITVLTPISGRNFGPGAKAVKGLVLHLPMPVERTFDYAVTELEGQHRIAFILNCVPTKAKVIWQKFVDLDKVLEGYAWLKANNLLYRHEALPTRLSLEGRVQVEEVTEEMLSESQQTRIENIPVAQAEPHIEHVDKDAPVDQHYSIMCVDEDTRGKKAFFEMMQGKTITGEPVPDRHKDLDCLAFPNLFPTGRFGMHAHRTKLVRSDAYLRYVMNVKTAQFRTCLPYVFAEMHKLWQRQLDAQIYLMKNTAALHLSKRQLAAGIRAESDDTYLNLGRVLRKVKGSAEYMRSVRSDLIACCKEWGAPTWFVTISFKDYANDELSKFLRKRNAKLAGVDKKTCQELIVFDPVSAQMFFDEWADNILEELIKVNKAHGAPQSTAGCFGRVIHYWYRVELQARGTPHLHILLWIENAPVCGVSTDEEVITFATKYVTCRLPDKMAEPLLHRLVTENQVHKCTLSCRRHKISAGKQREYCRYGYPRRMCGQDQINAAEKVIKSRISKNEQRKLLEVTRTDDEIYINDYSPALLMATRSNCDAQFMCDNSLSVCFYVAGYVTKEEKTAAEVVSQLVDRTANVHSLAKTFGLNAMRSRQVPAQEAAMVILGTPYYRCSSIVKYLNVGYNRHRLISVKGNELKEGAEDEPVDLETINMIDYYYPHRPASMEDWCLYDVMQKMDVVDRETEFEIIMPGGDYWKYFNRRKFPLVLKAPYRALNTENGRKQSIYDRLQMFMPYRDEENDLLRYGTLEETFAHALATIEALVNFEEKQDVWNKMKEQIAQWQEESLQSTVTEDVTELPSATMDRMREEMVHNQTSDLMDVGQTENKMNAVQRQVYDTVIGRVNHIAEHKNGTCACDKPPKPLNMFVSGVAGTGKSFLINALIASVTETHVIKTKCGYPAVCVAAPTGIAAFPLGGKTLHSLFALGVQHTRGEATLPIMSDITCKMNSVLYQNNKLIIIDEASMVSNLTLGKIHCRTSAWWPEGRQHFGGASVIMFGDLLQLPPVSADYIFAKLKAKQISSKLNRTSMPNLWASFEYAELTEIMRQKDDLQFAEMLNRLRIGSATDDDIELYKSRLLDMPDQTGDSVVAAYLRLVGEGKSPVVLMGLCDAVDAFNKAVLLKLGVECITVTAVDYNMGDKKLKNKRKKKFHAKANVKGKKTSETAGLEEELLIGKNVRVLLRRNLNTNIGLVNGALGTVVDWKYDMDKRDTVSKLIIKFDSIDDPQIIEKIKAEYEIAPSVYNYREQFPIVLAYAMTIHKSQGLSIDCLMADLGTRNIFCDGQTYVALSRARRLDQVYLIDFDPSKIKANVSVVLEYNRLRATASGLPPIVGYNRLPEKCKRTLTVTVRHEDENDANIAIIERKQNEKLKEPVVPTAQRARNYTPVTYKNMLLLTNTRVESCYANSVLQSLFRLPYTMNCLTVPRAERTLYDDTVPEYNFLADDEQLENAYKELYLKYGSETVCKTDLDDLRTKVAETYRPGTNYQSADEFLMDFLGKMPSIRRLFLTRVTESFKCTQCYSEYVGEIDRKHVMYVRRPLEGSVKFIDAVDQLRTVAQVEKTMCGIEGCNNKHFDKITVVDISDVKYLVLVLHSHEVVQQTRIDYVTGEEIVEHVNRPLRGQITEFKSNAVTFRGSDRVFVTKSIVCYLNENHYVTWIREDDHWRMIDCLKANAPFEIACGSVQTKLFSNLNNAALIFLEAK